MPHLHGLLREWLDLKMDVHLKLWLHLSQNELRQWFADETEANQRARIA
eukprot:CAMPEP_0197059844 /NCGR_PEP_ID=MMETSP1384-20130603/121638_1 /TAXON_ID=29189 /ORGANISM="Ammonia sp." /LENGTH=48 /DNA_ID= /DNA_START= /DNA_END= /DNA_ORIENTATION=